MTMIRQLILGVIFLSQVVFASVTITSDYSALKPGLDVWLKVVLELEDGAHTYGENPGEVGYPIQVNWNLPEGVTLIAQEWGEPISFSFEGIEGQGYEDEADLYFLFRVSEDTQLTEFPFHAVISYLECTDVCIPKKAEGSLVLTLGTDPISYTPFNVDRTTDVSFWVMVGLAFLGGIVLNIMPCVFPILSLKAIQVLDQSGDSKALKIEGLGYTLGILVSFTVFGVIIAGLKWSGESIGWGFQLQSPGFVLVLLSVMVYMGLFLQGRVSLPLWLLSVSASSGQAQYALSKHKSSFFSSFTTGILAALVSTPCTAPFMATALGFALTQPYLILLSILWALGLGLSSPFILISFFPRVSNWLPKSGPWLETAKHYLAFPLYFTGVWLLWVFVLQVGYDAILWVGIIGVLIIMIADLRRDRFSAMTTRILTALLIAGVVYSVLSLFSNPPESEPSSFSENTIQAALNEGRPVFVDVTASWCLTCKVNEKAVLKTEAIQQFFADNQVMFLQADWTSYDDSITAYLESFDRSGVPLYVVYLPGLEPRVLPQLLTHDIVRDAFIP